MGVLVAQLAKASAMKAASLGQIQPETIVACQPSFFFLSQSTLSAAFSYKNKAKQRPKNRCRIEEITV